MLEERGRVIAIEPGFVRVRVERQSACSGCQARAACGSGLMQTVKPGHCHEVQAISQQALQIGDDVVLGVSEELMLRSAFLVYVLPLLVLLLGAAMGQLMGLSEGWSIILAAVGFAASFIGLRIFNKRHQDDVALVPVVLRAE